MSHFDNSSTRAAEPVDGATLAEALDRWLWWRGEVKRPPTRIPLSWLQIDALEAVGAIEWSYFDFPVDALSIDGAGAGGGERAGALASRRKTERGVHTIPFYRGFRIVMQETT